MSEGHELGLPTPTLATDAQQQAPPGFENQQSGGEGRPRRRGRPRPRGGARERERREKKERRERQQGGNGLAEGETPHDGAGTAGEPTGSSAAPMAGPGTEGNERRGGHDGRGRGRGRGRGEGGGGGRDGRGGVMRMAWHAAVDEATGQPLTREQLWSTASDAAEAGAAKAAAGGEAGGGEGAEEGAGGAQPPQGGQEEAPGGPQAHAFEAGHLLEIARDPQSGEVLGVREIWLAPPARRRPRNRTRPNGSGGGGDGGGDAGPDAGADVGADAAGDAPEEAVTSEAPAAPAKATSPAAEGHDDQAAAAERLMSELGV